MIRIDPQVWEIAALLVAIWGGGTLACLLWEAAIILWERLIWMRRHPRDLYRVTARSLDDYGFGLPRGDSNGSADESAQVPATEGQCGQRESAHQEAGRSPWDPGLHRPDRKYWRR